MKPLIIDIPGKPIPSARPRFVKICGYGRAYDSQIAKKQVVKSLLRQISLKHTEMPYKGPLRVELWFDMHIQNIALPGTSNAILWPYEIPKYLPGKKPDIDNLSKFALDCCNGIIWVDDSQIVDLFSKKRYSIIPKTVMSIQEIDYPPFFNSIILDCMSKIDPKSFDALVCDIFLQLCIIQCPIALTGLEKSENSEWFLQSMTILKEFIDKHWETLQKIHKLKNPGEM